MKSDINVKLIEGYLSDNNLTKSSFCKKCRIATSTYEKILNNNFERNIIALCKIAHQMDMHISEMFI